jgi:uncharacterized protein with gpF-like domain
LPTLDPHHGTPAYHQGISRIHGTIEKVFRKQKEKAIAELHRLTKARIWKADDDASDYDADEMAEKIYNEIRKEFDQVPSQARAALEDAFLAGINSGILQLEIHDTKLIAAANQIAMDFARDRGAELVGMKYDDEGNLVDNPNAEWAISDTTRDKIKSIVTQGFSGETKITDIAAKIQQALQDDDAGIFTDARAMMIARTEVANAQAGGNFDVWKRSGMVKTVKWTVSADEPCDDCADNEDEEVPFGEAFPSGDLLPPAHPNCRCVLVTVKLADDDEDDQDE